MEVGAEVVEALEAMAGLPAVAFSRLHVEQHLASRSTLTPAVLLTKLLVNTSSCLLMSLGGSRAKVGRGAKLDLQQGAHFAIHSLEGEAGCSACSPDPVEGGEKLVKLTSI